MKWSAVLKLAYYNLLSSKMRTMLTVGGVALGIGAIVILLSLGYGLQNLTIKQVATLNALYTFDAVPGGAAIKLDQAEKSKLKSLAHVDEVLPILNLAGKLKYENSQIDTVIYSTSSRYLELSDIVPNSGQKWTDDSSNYAIPNTALLKLMGIDKNYHTAIGKELSLDILVTKALLLEGEKKTVPDLKYEVIGVITDDTSPAIFIPYERTIKDTGITIDSAVKIYVANRGGKGELIDATRKEAELLGYKTTYIGDTISQIESVFSVFRIVLGAFGIIAVIVAALGMFNTLTVSLLERTREVAIMKALGARKRDVYKMFLIEAVFISVFGGVLGVVISVLTGWAVNFILTFLSKRAGGTEALQVFAAPSTFILFIIVFVFAIGFLTGLYPATRAARIKALDALRYE